MRLEIIEQIRHAVLNEVIDHGEVCRKNEYRNHDDGGRGLHFLPRRRRDLAHFAAHVVIESLDAIRPGLDLVAEVAARCRQVRHFLRLDCHSYSLNLPLPLKNLAGAEGFEPPSSVLETDSLTVELTPLYLVPSPEPLVPREFSRDSGLTARDYFTSLCGVCLRQRL